MALALTVAAAARDPGEGGTGTGRTGILWEIVSRADSARTVAVRPPSFVDMERFRELIRRGFLTRHPAKWSIELEEDSTGEERR
ncbi:MAG: hypothetical protein R6U36_07895 [Candidatus Fermentibacteraceae bacterium]